MASDNQRKALGGIFRASTKVLLAFPMAIGATVDAIEDVATGKGTFTDGWAKSFKRTINGSSELAGELAERHADPIISVTKFIATNVAAGYLKEQGANIAREAYSDNTPKTDPNT